MSRECRRRCLQSRQLPVLRRIQKKPPVGIGRIRGRRCQHLPRTARFPVPRISHRTLVERMHQMSSEHRLVSIARGSGLRRALSVPGGLVAGSLLNELGDDADNEDRWLITSRTAIPSSDRRPRPATWPAKVDGNGSQECRAFLMRLARWRSETAEVGVDRAHLVNAGKHT